MSNRPEEKALCWRAPCVFRLAVNPLHSRSIRGEGSSVIDLNSFCFPAFQNANSCPVDRIAFNSIYLRKCYGGKVKKMVSAFSLGSFTPETLVTPVQAINIILCGRFVFFL